MQGQVFVPYTGIGGFNMNTGIMPMAIGGSSASADAAASRTINVLWTLPGGISNIKNRGQNTYQGGEWGYLFTPKADEGLVVHDEDVISWVKTQVPGSDFDDNGELITMEYQAQVEQAINNKLYEYVGRALKGQGESSWDNFVDYFGEGICVFINY